MAEVKPPEIVFETSYTFDLFEFQKLFEGQSDSTPCVVPVGVIKSLCKLAYQETEKLTLEDFIESGEVLAYPED